MLTVNVVTRPGWILERLARELAGRLPGVTVNAGQAERAVDPSAGLQYYLPARDSLKYPSSGPAVGFYTHGDAGFQLIPQFAGVGAMNARMAAALEAAGARDVALIRPGADQVQRPVVFGVCGRIYASGRKGEALVARAVRAGFQVVACGAGRRPWPCTQPWMADERDEFYRAIDYLLVTSTEEGGPMTVPEALARGVPVIAPDVGWCWEFPVIRYEVGSWPSLCGVLQGLAFPPTWADWAEGHRRWFSRLEARAA